MWSPSSIGIHDDLPARQAAVTMSSANLEPACRVDVDDGLLVKEMRRDDDIDHMLDDVLPDTLLRDITIVLCGNHHRVDAHRFPAGILDGDLGFCIRPD